MLTRMYTDGMRRCKVVQASATTYEHVSGNFSDWTPPPIADSGDVRVCVGANRCEADRRGGVWSIHRAGTVATWRVDPQTNVIVDET